ncbi:MAG: hypothetical protein A2939_00310 [Parcubacteria group bacterium RIFCSPLOWO2_01_FULL_48_18]|nr:MAG: hypothetical protein A2939_00310 [Parcubacteria group bacterium RIFCSPLOWO2_01_FULL_48_18]
MIDKPSFDEKKAVQKAKKGNASSFGLLYDHYVSKIYRFVFVKVMSRQDAEDICQQVFLSAWQNIRAYEEVGFPFSSWLYRIARNAVIDFYRLRRPTVNIENIEPLLADYSDASFAIEQGLAVERILRAVARLTDEQREVVVMKFVEDLDNEEIARALEKNEGAVRVLQHRALENLKKFVADADRIREA